MRTAGNHLLSWVRHLRTPLSLGIVGAAVVAVAAWTVVGGWSWLPIPLAVLTVGLLAECVSTQRPTVSTRMAIATAAMIVGLLAAVTMSTDGLLGVPDRNGSSEVALASPATTTPEVDVEGATLGRDEWDRLESCERSLRTIAETLHLDADPLANLPDANGEDARLRLRSCEVRIEAIALTLEP